LSRQIPSGTRTPACYSQQIHYGHTRLVDLEELLDADALFGWPLDTIDQLTLLEERADAGELSITAWRVQDAAVRAHLPAVEPGELATATNLARDAIIRSDTRTEATIRLHSRLSTIRRGAPTDADLRKQLGDLPRYLNKPELADYAAERRERIIGWLRDSGELDHETKLPWSLIAGFRTLTDPQLGVIPQSVTAARKRAIGAATTEQLDQARALGGGRVNAVNAAFSDLTDSRMTYFAKLLLDDETTADQAALLCELWQHPATQDALRRATADGWPPEYA
jgi:hypothetical protein